MKSIALAVLAVLVTTLAGCAIVPVGPPFVVGVRAHGDYGYGYDRGYDRGYYRGGGYYR